MSVSMQVDSLSMPLPEYILKMKWAGDLAGATRAIDLKLQDPDLPAMLKERLKCEKERIRRLPTQYPFTRKEAIEKIREAAPGTTEEEFDLAEADGWIDFIYLNGEKRYFCRFHRTLLKYPMFYQRAGITGTPVSKWLDPMIAEIRQNGSLTKRITLEASLSLEENRFIPGVYRCWLPVAAASAQQHDIRIEGECDRLQPQNAEARTVYWQKKLQRWQDFRVRYSYTSTIRYADPLNAPAPGYPLYPDAKPVEAADLAEEGAYIRFTPYLRSLAEELSAGAVAPVEKAWRFYQFVTTKVKYSFMRDYFQIDNLGEYCAIHLKGDCGLQALLFIILCRIVGIPARWQSGLAVEEKYASSHDWAQFYLDGWGWLFADPSYGGGAWRNGNAERHQFYFGNLDPTRMVANCRYQAAFEPASHVLRYDPFDNQDGELELVGAALPFTGRDLNGSCRVIEIK